MALVAKPILKNKSWIITDNGIKVGNVELTNDGYYLKLGDKKQCFDSTKTLSRSTSIEFHTLKNKNKVSISYAKWPTPLKTYNDMFDVKRKLHLFTKTKKSKCYYAAGWFKININNMWQTMFCPKYIFVTRYDYLGPFQSQSDLEINT